MNLKQILNDCWTRVRSIRIGRIFDYVGKIISKLYSFSWRTAIILLVCSAVCFLHDEISWAIKRNTREIVSYRNYLGNDIKVKKFGNGTCYTYDYVKGKRISPKLKWVSTLPERDSLTVFCDRKGLRGFLNVNTGKIEIPGQYYRAWHFSEGLAAVADEEGRVGFINHANEMVIPMDFDRVYGNDYIFLNGYCIIQDKESGLWGAIDTTGEWKLRPEYSGIYNVAGYDLWLVYLEDKEGLLDENMEFIFEPVYDDVDCTAPDGSVYLTKSAVKQQVALNGEVLNPFVIDRTNVLLYPDGVNEDGSTRYSQHPSLVSFSISPVNIGVMNSYTGEIVVPAIYDNIDMISYHLIGADLSYGIEKIVYTIDGVKLQNASPKP